MLLGLPAEFFMNSMVPPARYTSPNSQLKSLYLYTFRPLYYLIFNLPVYSLLPLSDCYAPTNSIIPPEKAPCCVSLLLPLLLHIDCFHPGVLMLIAHSPIKVCSMIFPYMPCFQPPVHHKLGEASRCGRRGISRNFSPRASCRLPGAA